MVVNTDMKKALKESCTCCVPGCSNTKRDQKLSFLMFPWDVSLGVKLVNSIGRKDFISGEKPFVCSQILMVPKKQGRSLLHFHCFLDPNRENLQKYTCTWTSSQKEDIRTKKSKALEDAIVEEVDFLLVPMRRKELTWS